MAFYTLPPFLLPNTPDADATEQERQEWRERVSGFLRHSSQNIEELGEAYIGNGVQLADLVVDTAHINDAAITTAKIGSLAVTSAEIADASITTAKIVDAAITTAKIGSLQVTGALIAEGTITATKIQANTITAAEIAAATITATEIAANSISVSNLRVGNFDNVIENPGFELTTASGALISPAWTNGSDWAFNGFSARTGTYHAAYAGAAAATLTADTVVPIVPGEEWHLECQVRCNSTNTIGGGFCTLVWLDTNQTFHSQDNSNAVSDADDAYHIAFVDAVAPTGAAYVLFRGRITAPSAGNTIRFDDFYARRKTGGAFIENASILNAHIVDGTILSAKIADAQISTAHIIDLNVTGAKIADATITTAKIGNLQVTGALIATGTITAANIAANTITAAEIAAGTITAAEIAADSITVSSLTVGNFDNVIENPGFELSTASGATISPGWTLPTGTITAQFSARSGAYQAQYSGVVSSAVLSAGNVVSVTPGEEWYLEGYVRCNANNTTGAASVVLVWLDAAQVFVSQDVGNAVSDADSSYHISSIAAVAPAGAAYVLFRGRVNTPPSAGGNIKFDDFYAKRKIGTAFIENAAITTALIANAAITTALIDNAAITTAKIGNAQITTALIANLAVGTALIANAAITTAKIGAAQITTALIANAAITNALIADASITTAKIVDASITTAKIVDAIITTAKIADASITTAKIQDLSVSTAKIANLAVGSAQIASLAVATAKIGDLQVSTLKVGDNQISTAKRVNVSSFTQAFTGLAGRSSQSVLKTHNLGQVVTTAISISSNAGGTIDTLPFVREASINDFRMEARNLATSTAGISLTYTVYYW